MTLAVAALGVVALVHGPAAPAAGAGAAGAGVAGSAVARARVAGLEALGAPSAAGRVGIFMI
jgi:hypothetical protein